MTLVRLAVLGLLGYTAYQYFSRPKAAPSEFRGYDGLAALYETREQADIAIEHLVQEHGVDRAAIFAEPVADGNSSGAQISSGDAPSGDAGSRTRSDAPVNGAIRVSVGVSKHDFARLRGALEQAGATHIEAI